MSAHLLDTAAAEVLAGRRGKAFLMWARRAGVRPACKVRRGRSTVARWDLDQLVDALSK